MLGEVTISFTFASPNVLIGAAGTNADIKTANSTLVAANLDAEINDAVINNTDSYVLKGIKMSMVRYSLPVSYSEALRSNLSGGAKYQIAFNHYEVHSGSGLVSGGSVRWNENSKDIKGLLAYFTSDTKDSNKQPSVFSKNVESSVYFQYDNTIHANLQFQIGSEKTPQNAVNSTDCFLELTRSVPGARSNNVEFFHKLKSVEDWLESYFMAYLSLEFTEGMTDVSNGGKKLLSGLSSEHLPISCSYEYKNKAVAGGFAWHKRVNVMSLTIENGQNVYTEI